jgi:hypothetical protein
MTEKKKQFVLAWASSLEDLETQVNEFLDEGYELKGNAFATIQSSPESEDYPVTAQVLVPKRIHKKKD